MADWLEEVHHRRDGVTIPTIWVAIALSVLLHIMALGKWLPQVRLPSTEELAAGETSRSLVVNLAPPPSPPPAPPPSPAPRPAPAPTLQAPPPTIAARPRPAPPVIALNKPAPDMPSSPTAITPSAPAPPAEAGDLSSYIEARRRARAASAPPAPSSPSAGSTSNAPPVEDAKARSDRAVAANLGLNRAPTFGPDATRNGGGVFQIQRVGYSDAEFLFYGWNKDIRRNTTQMIEVRKGDNSDIRIAVVRKMIAIIREHEQEDFLWESPRLGGRSITLSARQRDNAGLEEFMMREFFLNERVR